MTKLTRAYTKKSILIHRRFGFYSLKGNSCGGAIELRCGEEGKEESEREERWTNERREISTVNEAAERGGERDPPPPFLCLRGFWFLTVKAETLREPWKGAKKRTDKRNSDILWVEKMPFRVVLFWQVRKCYGFQRWRWRHRWLYLSLINTDPAITSPDTFQFNTVVKL